MPKPRIPISTRVTRLERLMEVLADAQLTTELRFQQTDRRLLDLANDADERERRMDERIGKLVSAIGEFIRKNGGPA